MNSNIKKLGTMFAAVTLIAGLLSIAPIQSSHAAVIDVTDFGCFGVNNCNVENDCPAETTQKIEATNQSLNVVPVQTSTIVPVCIISGLP